ncbi:MAG TPA: helix-turn-helix domain-containing protein [Candidatus Paceibacterota bacterium]|nr:helix-turn-helix domain-containing protein [Candidatus Paceibacterota bacterium]
MDEKIKSELQTYLKTDTFSKSHKLLRVICGPTRHKIIHILNRSKRGLTETEIAHVLSSSLSKISHQMKILKEHELIVSSGKGRDAIYRLANHKIKNFLG